MRRPNYSPLLWNLFMLATIAGMILLIDQLVFDGRIAAAIGGQQTTVVQPGPAPSTGSGQTIYATPQPLRVEPQQVQPPVNFLSAPQPVEPQQIIIQWPTVEAPAAPVVYPTAAPQIIVVTATPFDSAQGKSEPTVDSGGAFGESCRQAAVNGQPVTEACAAYFATQGGGR